MTWDEIGERLRPVAAASSLTTAGVITTLVVAAVLAIGPTWPWLRLGVTLVHELGHAVVGVASGRRFTGFVVGGDGSGHAVTLGAPRGAGRVATTWAGYPMPALVGALLVRAAASGWAAPVVGGVLVLLLLVLIRVRSVLTLLVVLVVGGALAGLWWRRDDAVQAYVLLVAGLLLLVGAWRHLQAVWADGGRGDDHRALASLTGIPALVWLISWAAVCAGATWAVWLVLRPALAG